MTPFPRLAQKLHLFAAYPMGSPIAFFILCILAYGLLAHRLGFYWDDWPWMWMAHARGAQSLMEIDQAHRPLSGVILWLSEQISIGQPTRWQWLTLFYRWLSGLTLWWALRQLWPGQSKRLVWVVCLFLVYPGFSHQFVAVNSSRHILPLSFTFTSFGLMTLSVRCRERFLPYTLASITLAMASMASTEYYYGLELTRPVWIWLALDSENKRFWERTRKAAWLYLPYLTMQVAVFAWRYVISLNVNYRITLITSLSTDPVNTVALALETLWENAQISGVQAWGKIFTFPQVEIFGRKKTLFYWALVTSSVLFTFVYLIVLELRAGRNDWWKEALFLGLITLFVGSLPFLATGITVGLGFPSSRTTLPMAVGAAILMTSLLDGLIRQRFIKIGALCLIVGLAVGVHFQSAVAFQRDWNYQVDFFRQLGWRIPSLKPGTAILTLELPNTFSSDNSLTAPLNWYYAPTYSEGDLPYKMYYLEVRVGGRIPSMESGQTFNDDYGDLIFRGSTDRAIVVFYSPPACLRVLHPRYDATYPQLPHLLTEALPLANLHLILPDKDTIASSPYFFDTGAGQGWCYYFEKADLARQFRDWEKVVALAELAFATGDSPNHAAERAPFIQGYAYTGHWERAKELSLEMVNINSLTAPMLCSLWEDIAENTPGSAARESILEEMRSKLNCPK